MNAQWWEGLAKFLCGYWWLFLILLFLLLLAFFTRELWYPPLVQMLGF
jgi:hypothetical protein